MKKWILAALCVAALGISGAAFAYTVNTDAGYVAPTISIPSIPQGTGTAIGGEGASSNPGNAFDANDATYASGSENTAAYVGKNWGGGNTKLLARVIVTSPAGRSFTGGGENPNTLSYTIDGSTNGSSWVTIDSGTINDTGSSSQKTLDRTLPNPGSTAYQYHRVRLSRGNAAGWRIAEIQFYELGDPNNMTVVTTTQTADATISNARVLLEYNPVDSITLNTDLTVEVTCDGGANWAMGTLSAAGTGQAGRLIAETADTSCGANTGTSWAARIKTLNNKSIEIHGTSLSVR